MSQLPDMGLSLQGARMCVLNLLVDHSDRKPRSGVFRGGSALVGRETPPQIDGDPRVEGPVAAFQDVDQPAMHRHIIHIRRGEGSARPGATEGRRPGCQARGVDRPGIIEIRREFG